jgi:hypothetical protein
LYQPERVNRIAAIAATIFAGICALGFLLILLVQPASWIKACTFEAWPWFKLHFLECALITAAGCVLMWAWLVCKQWAGFVAGAIGLFAVGELLISAWGYNPQVAPETYYPKRSFISYLKDNSGNGRILGIGGVLYPNVSMAYDLRDIRGYDGVDPLPYLGLLWAANPQAPLEPPYAVSMYFSIRWIVDLPQSIGLGTCFYPAQGGICSKGSRPDQTTQRPLLRPQRCCPDQPGFPAAKQHCIG